MRSHRSCANLPPFLVPTNSDSAAVPGHRRNTRHVSPPLQWLCAGWLLAALFGSSTRAAAQAENASDSAIVRGATAASFDRAAWRIGPYIGRASQSPVTETLGTTPGRDHLFLGVQALTPILRLGEVHVSYMAQLLPFVRFQGRTPPVGYGGPRAWDGLLPSADFAYAVGFSPFGVELTSNRSRRVAAFAATSAGALYFEQPYPIPEAGRFNFTLEYGAGALVRVSETRWIRAGYKYHHLSNAFTARDNPGVDGNVWYAGFEWGLALPK